MTAPRQIPRLRLTETAAPHREARKDAVLRVAKAMSAEGLVVGSVGNVSCRCGEAIIVTPTRLPYSRMGVDDLVTVSASGETLDGKHRPSRELPLHLALYRRRPDIGAVVHTHSPHATAWSFLDSPLLPETEENHYYGIGPVRTTIVAAPGSADLATDAAERLGDSAAVLLGRHGVLAAAADPAAALEIAQVVERQAQIAWILRGGGAS
ncbi:MAG TPA: class II aldolase/adducin family protein [Solirubrobacterales bacterium]